MNVKRCICLSGLHMSPTDMKALASILYHQSHLSKLELINCHLTKECIHALAGSLRGSAVKIDVLDVSFNGKLRADSLGALYEICLRTRGLNYWQCGFKQRDLLTFKEAEYKQEEAKSTKEGVEARIRDQFDNNCLDLNYKIVEEYSLLLHTLVDSNLRQSREVDIVLSGYETSSTMRTTLDLIGKCVNVGELRILECKLTESQLQSLSDALHSKKLRALNVCLCPDITAVGWKFLGALARNSATELFITACGLTEQALLHLAEGLAATKLRKLDASRDDHMDSKCLEALGNIVSNCRVEELVLGYCRLTCDGVNALKRGMEKAKLRRLDVSGNDGIGIEGFRAIGQIVRCCRVQELDISECDPNPDDIRSLKESIADFKMVKLNVSRNERMHEGGLEDLGELVAATGLRELFIRQCALNESTLSSFKKGLGNAQIPRLDLGHYFMKDRKTTDDELGIVDSLLENVTEQLTLNKWEIGNDRRVFLQKALNRIPHKGLTIQLNRSVDDLLRQEE